MVGFLIIGLLVALGFVGQALHLGQQPHPAAFVGLLVSGVALGAIIIQWLSHPESIKDWVQGGLIDLTNKNGRLTWLDWEVLLTRRGSVDLRTKLVKLERLLLFGLIPVGAESRPLTDFYRVEVETTPRTSTRRYRSFGFIRTYEYETVIVGYTYTVSLVDRSGNRLTVMDLGAGLHGPEEQFIARVRQQLEELVGRPGELGPAHRPDIEVRPREKPTGPDDFEAWRQKRTKG